MYHVALKLFASNVNQFQTDVPQRSTYTFEKPERSATKLKKRIFYCGVCMSPSLNYESFDI